MNKKEQTLNTYNESVSSLAKKFDELGARVSDIEETFALIPLLINQSELLKYPIVPA